MTRKDRFPEGYPNASATCYESEGSGSLGRIDMEITASEGSSALKRKWINLNSGSQDGFSVPIQVIPLSKLTQSERKSLVFWLRSELEQLRLFQKKAESWRVNGVRVSSSRDIVCCNNVQKGLPGGSLKRFAGSNSGPVVKSNGPDKGPAWSRSNNGRFQSQKKAPVSLTDAALLKQCDSLLKRLMSHQFGWVFNEPVDIVKLKIPDYPTVIKHPMDLGTIKTKLSSNEYSNALEFLADVRLTFSNAMTYNPPGNDVHFMADTMSKFFEARCKAIEKKVSVTNSYSLPENSSHHKEIDIVDPVASTKKRKHSPTQHEVVQRRPSPVQREVMAEPVKRKMTDEEKLNLSRDLEASVGDLTDNIIEFLKEISSNGRESGEDDIEIDIDVLSEDTLFTLRKLLDEFFQQKHINNANAETCEMELPNESGLSNSSMQLSKGNDHVDEDVDIGGDEPPAASCPPVKIEKDTKHTSYKCSNTESFDGNTDSDCSSSSDSEPEYAKESTLAKPAKNGDGSEGDFNGKPSAQDMVDGEGEGSPTERPVPENPYRAALLKNRFADTILKAREKSLGQGEKADLEKLRRDREELEMLKSKEKARLQAEAKAAEDAQRRAEAEAMEEAKRKREVEREAARQALLKMEKTVEINENSRFLQDLEMLSAVTMEHLPGSVDETSPDDLEDGLGSFKVGSSNPLEQLGLYMKADDDEEEAERKPEPTNTPDVEEGEID